MIISLQFDKEIPSQDPDFTKLTDILPFLTLLREIASKEVLDKFVLAKQAADLCTNVFSQYVAYEYINGGYLDKQVLEIKKMYKIKRDIMLKALEKHFPKNGMISHLQNY